MAVVVVDNRTEIDDAESLTGWTSSFADELVTADPDPVEGSNSIGMSVSEDVGSMYHTISSTNMNNTLVYVWVQTAGTLETLANGGIGIVLGDGTDRIAYHLAGSDVAAFRHSLGPVFWQCLVIDTNNLPTDFTVLAGVEADLSVNAITEVGAYYEVTSKALGGALSAYIDIMRYGTGGMIVRGGTSGDPGTFAEIEVADKASTAAYGILRELSKDIYGVQGSIVFGDSGGITNTYFADVNSVVAFEDRGLSPGRFGITITGNSTGTQFFQLGVKVGSQGGAQGCTLTAPVGTGPFFSASASNVTDLNIYGCSLIGFTGSIVHSFNATNGANHEIFDNFYEGNGQISINRVQFRNHSIVGAVLPNEQAGAIQFPSSSFTALISDLSFVMGVTGHAVRSFTGNAGETIEFDNYTYTGYSTSMIGATFDTETDVNGTTEVVSTKAAHGFKTAEPVVLNDDGGTETIGLTENVVYWVRSLTAASLSFHTSAADALSDTARVNLTASGGGSGEIQSLYSADAAFINESGGEVTVEVVDGDIPSYRNVAGATTIIIANVAVTFIDLIVNSEVRIYLAGTNTEVDGVEANATSTFAATAGKDIAVDYVIMGPVDEPVAYVPIRVENITFSEATTIAVAQVVNRNFLDPD